MISIAKTILGFIRTFIVDWYATLSNEKTYLSSKRIERALLFNSALGMCLCYVWYSRASITTTEIVAICTMLFGYAGFNVAMGVKDKKVDAEIKQQTAPAADAPSPPGN